MKLEPKFMLKYLYSNKFLLILLFLIPFILSISFGHILYSDGNLGSNLNKEAGLKKFDHGHPFKDFDGSLKKSIYENYFNVSSIKPTLNSLKSIRFYTSFFDSLRQTSKISILLGGVIAIITGGKMVEDRSIVYLIVNKKNRLKSFSDLFLLPLPFLVLTIFLASLSILTISLNSFVDISISKILVVSFISLILSALEGYIFANFLILLIRNNTSSLLSLFGIVFILPIFERGKLIILPFTYLTNNLIYDIPLPQEDYIFLGCLIISILPFISYYIYTRGDFYK